MTYDQLTQRLILQSHRSDLSNNIPGFVEDARMKINQRLGLELVPMSASSDTNDVMLNNYLLYFYGALVSLYQYIVEMETADYFDQLFWQQCDSWHVTATGTTPLTIEPENPAP